MIRNTDTLESLNDFLFAAFITTIVATIDESGLITGVSVGETTIEVTDKFNPDLKISVPVYVMEVLKQRAVNSKLNALSEINEDDLTAIVDHELYQKRIYKNGVLQSSGIWNQELIASYDDAYFRIRETDADVETENGSMTFSDYDWIFNTNKFYDTLVYHPKSESMIETAESLSHIL